MKVYNKYQMTEKLIIKAEKKEEICVCDFPSYDEHEISEIEGILKSVAAELEANGYEVVTYPAPKCAWGLADKTLLTVKIRFPWG